jgi:hypothetical protein
MANLLVQAINAGDGDQAARIVQNAVTAVSHPGALPSRGWHA